MTQSLLNSEILTRIIDGSPIPSFVINNQHQVMHWNTAIEALSGIKKEEIIGTDQQWRAFYAKQRPTLADLIVSGAPVREIEGYYSRECTRSHLIDGAYEAEDFFPDLGSSGKWLHFTASPIRNNNGVTMGAIETLEDVTEHRSAEEALEGSEKNFRALFENAHDAIWLHDLEGNLITANRAATKLNGYSLEEMRQMNIRSFLSKESLSLAHQVRSKLLNSEPVEQPYEQRIFRRDGSEAIVQLSTSLVMDKNKPVAFQHIARDITEQKRMHENLRYYLQQITKAQEEERSRIARELHDDTAQVLGAISRQLDNFMRKKNNLASEDVLFFKDLQTQLNRGVQEVHRFSQALRLSVLDDLGLIPALRSLTKSLQQYNGVVTDLKVIGKERRFSSESELLLFRMVQEALNNVGKHARASEAHVVMDFGKDKIRVTISDNGRGFELTGRLDDLPRSGKLGLTGIQERARLLGGTLEVKSTLGTGTTLIVEVPY
jgi:PAS domain S-box-containing protein